MSDIKLKPCPYCGCDNIVRKSGIPNTPEYTLQCECLLCHTQGPKLGTDEAALGAWNNLPRHLQWTTELPMEAGW